MNTARDFNGIEIQPAKAWLYLPEISVVMFVIGYFFSPILVVFGPAINFFVIWRNMDVNKIVKVFFLTLEQKKDTQKNKKNEY